MLAIVIKCNVNLFLSIHYAFESHKICDCHGVNPINRMPLLYSTLLCYQPLWLTGFKAQKWIVQSTLAGWSANSSNKCNHK